MIQAVDDGVSLIMDQIKTLDLDEKTAVVFSRTTEATGQLPTCILSRDTRAPIMRGDPGSLFIKWPGVVQAGSTNQTPIIGVDLTLLFWKWRASNPQSTTFSME